MIKIVKQTYAFIKRIKAYFYPGLALFLIMFIFSNYINFSSSYMGTKVDSIIEIIYKEYLFNIILIIIKILFVYLVAGCVLSAAFYRASLELKKRLNLKINGFFTAFAGLCVFVFLLFSEKMIINPQLYSESFETNCGALSLYQKFITGSVSPNVFSVPLSLLSAAVIILCVISFDLKNIFIIITNKLRTIKHKKTVAASLLALLIIFIIFHIPPMNDTQYSDHPNIIILSSDALRPDHFSCNGYTRKTTPNIDRIAAESLQVRGVFTTVPRTFPAWVSILTSQYPLSNKIQHMFPRTAERNVKWNTVPGHLNNLGYRTAVISDFGGDIFPRLEFGFLKTLISMIKSSGRNPFFIVVFHSVTHFPFSAPYPYYKKFSDPAYNGPYKYLKQRVIKIAGSNSAEENTQDDEKQAVALYDGCLNLFDREVGVIYDYLMESGLIKNTILIITSDHGENLYEPGLGLGHGEHLKSNYPLEVPLIIHSEKLNGRKGEKIFRPSSIIDIMPTVYDIAGINRPAFFNGVSILSNDKDISRSDINAYAETGIWFDNNKSSPLFFNHSRIDYPDITGISEIDFSYRDEVVIQEKYQNIVNAAKYRTIYSGRYKLIYIPLKDGSKFIKECRLNAMLANPLKTWKNE
ncbi:MAG: sulfatase [Spirochaetes bacterium]|nr:sulfatase [Spirochaetota bacterium]